MAACTPCILLGAQARHIIRVDQTLKCLILQLVHHIEDQPGRGTDTAVYASLHITSLLLKNAILGYLKMEGQL